MHSTHDLKALFRKYNFFPSKALGQNFLVDPAVAGRIVASLELMGTENVIEVGPGFGALTEQLVERGVRVTAIERDRRLAHALKDRWGSHSRVQIICEDVLQFDFEKVGEGPWVVLGNLPYVITSPVLEKLVLQRKRIVKAVLTVQREVAERIAASPGGKTFGALTCFVQAYYVPELMFSIAPKAFFPQPTVTSTVLKLVPRHPPIATDDDLLPLTTVIQALFQRRRKTLLNGMLNPVLKLSRPQALQLLEQSGLSAQSRVETLAVTDLIRLSRNLPATAN